MAATTEGSKWDLEKLKRELQKCTETRDELLRTTLQLQHSVQNTERMIEGVPNEASVWRERHLQQQTHNHQLEAQLREIERKKDELHSQHRELAEIKQVKVSDQEMVHTYNGLSDVGLRQLLRRLEREKGEVERQLKDCEWRLDQEATAVHRAEEEKRVLITELGQATLELEKCKRHKDHPPPPPPQPAPSPPPGKVLKTHNQKSKATDQPPAATKVPRSIGQGVNHPPPPPATDKVPGTHKQEAKANKRLQKP